MFRHMKEDSMARRTSEKNRRVRNYRRGRSTRCFTAIGLAWALSLSLTAGPTIAFVQESFRVRAHDATPGGTVKFFSVSVEKHGYLKEVKPRLVFNQANLSGIAKQYNVFDVVDASIWAVCDLASQALTVGSPLGNHQERPVEGAVLLAHPGHLTYQGSRVELVAIRAGQVWHCRAADGGQTDKGAQPDEIRVPFKSFVKVEPGGSGVYTPVDGDVLIGIDADAMTYFTWTVASGGN